MFKITPQAPDFHIRHETHRETLLKFIALALLLAGYFAYTSWKYGTSTGLSASFLSWSFFVLCTPIADGGFVIAFPVRLLFDIKMSVTQVVLWFIAILGNIIMLIANPHAYDLTFLTKLLKHILATPYPYWSILILSAIGTFLSVYFGDEMMNVTAHKDCIRHHRHGLKYRTILIVGLVILTIISYYFLLNGLHIVLPE